MKLINHEPVLGTCKAIVGILCITISCIFFSILAATEASLCFASGFAFVCGALFTVCAILVWSIPVYAYDWHITADILAHCGLVSYITIWNIIKPGDCLTFSSIKYTGYSDEPAVRDTITWNIQSKGKYHVKVALDNGKEFTCLPCEFSQRIAKLTESHNNIMMNGKTIYSRIENILPKANWVIYP
jgi:hypothetical protein